MEDGKSRKTAAQQVQHAFEVVGEYMHAHLGAHPVERSGEEMGGTHPGLQSAERVLDRLATDPQPLASQPIVESQKLIAND